MTSILAASLERHRSALWRLCYRMTGSAADADDLVQDTFERALARPPRDQESELLPWLTQVALNLSRDSLRRRKRQAYVGPWLPSPIETSLDSAGYSLEPAPDARYGGLESVSMAFLIALEVLTPLQRAVLVLTDVLGHSVQETARLLDKSESNVKTSHHRARAALSDYDASRIPLTTARIEQTQQALSQFLFSLLAGDVAALEAQLSADVRALNDSDGEFHAAQVPVIGPARVIKFYLKVRRAEPPRFAIRQINGLPAVVAEYESALKGVARRMVFFVALDAEGRINVVNTTVAERKLRNVSFAF